MNSYSEQLMGVLLHVLSQLVNIHIMYQFSISTQLLGRQKISGRGSRRTMEKKEREKEFPDENTSPISALYQATLTCQLIYAVKLLFNIITVNSVKRCHKLNEVWVWSPQGIGSCIFRDSLWLFAMKSKLG